MAPRLALARALGRPELSQKVPVAAVRQNLAGHGPEVRAAFEPVLAKLDPGADAERKRAEHAEHPANDRGRQHVHGSAPEGAVDAGDGTAPQVDLRDRKRHV